MQSGARLYTWVTVIVPFLWLQIDFKDGGQVIIPVFITVTGRVTLSGDSQEIGCNSRIQRVKTPLQINIDLGQNFVSSCVTEKLLHSHISQHEFKFFYSSTWWLTLLGEIVHVNRFAIIIVYGIILDLIAANLSGITRQCCSPTIRLVPTIEQIEYFFVPDHQHGRRASQEFKSIFVYVDKWQPLLHE